MSVELTVPLGRKPRSLNSGHFLKHGIQNYNLATKRLKGMFGQGRYFGSGPSVAPTIAPESPAVSCGCKYF